MDIWKYSNGPESMTVPGMSLPVPALLVAVDIWRSWNGQETTDALGTVLCYFKKLHDNIRHT